MGGGYQFAARPDDEEEDVSASDIFRNITENTSAHGMPHVAKARGACKKVFWSILSLGFLAALGFNVFYITDYYLQYPVTVVISLQNEEELEFPTVTLCNMSPIKRSLWENFNTSNLESVTSSSGADTGSARKKRRRKRSTGIRECPSGWTEVSGKCLISVSGSRTWSQAVTECDNHYGGILATIEDATVQTTAASVLNGGTGWIGLNSNWGWSDGTGAAVWTDWDPTYGEPNEGTGCVRLRDSGGYGWADNACSTSYRRLCSIDMSGSCPSGWSDSGVRCYYASSTSGTQTGGDAYCDSVYTGATLAKVDTSTEKSYVTSNVLNGWADYWFGLKEVYEWSDGTSGLTYTNWDWSEPSGGPACAVMESDGDWDMKTCTTAYYYLLCQKDIPCTSTGPTCITSCSGLADGNYQSCERCNGYATCSGGVYFYMDCAGGTVWDDDGGACAVVSSTCTECYTQPTTVEALSTKNIESTIGYTTQHEESTILPSTQNMALTASQTTENKETTIALTTQNFESTAQESTAQESTAQESTAQETTAQESTAQRSTAQESTAQESTTVPYSTPNDVISLEHSSSLYSRSQTTESAYNYYWSDGDEAEQVSCTCCCGSQYVYIPQTVEENSTSPAIPSIADDAPALVENSQYERPALREDFQNVESVIETLADIPIESKRKLGYSISDVILDCQFEGSDCYYSDFDEINNPVYGNCYSFNTGWRKPAKTSKHSGQRYGLQLIMNLQQDEYMSDMAEAAGIKVLVHSGTKMPFPEDEGITVSPGMANFIGLTQVYISRLGNPYGECIDTTERNSEINVYEEAYPVNYSVNACQKTCLQRAIIDACDCADAYFPNTGQAFNKTVGICSVHNIQQDDCKYGVRKRFENNEIQCDCPNPCRSTLFNSRVSTALWPSDAQRDEILNRLAPQIPELLDDPNDPSKYTRNLLKLELYYMEFNYETMSEYPAYRGGNFASDLGGVIGLWFGLSALTICEFLEFFMDICIFGCSKCCRKNKVKTLRPDLRERYSVGEFNISQADRKRLNNVNRNITRKSDMGTHNGRMRAPWKRERKGENMAGNMMRGRRHSAWQATHENSSGSHISPPPPYRSSADISGQIHTSSSSKKSSASSKNDNTKNKLGKTPDEFFELMKMRSPPPKYQSQQASKETVFNFDVEW